MSRRIRTTPDFVKSPPLSNILMNLSVAQLREVLIEIVSWDSSGKDIFDCDYLFSDPIKGIPDLTISEYNGTEKVDWVRSRPNSAAKIAPTVAKILLASKVQSDFYAVALRLVEETQSTVQKPSSHYDILLALSLLHLYAKKHGHTEHMARTVSRLQPPLTKLYRSFYRC